MNNVKDEEKNWKTSAAWFLLLLLVTPYIIYLTPQYLGSDAYVVESGSMAPEMPEGSIVYESWNDPRSYEVGDVIIFRPNNSGMNEDLVVHRIIDIREGNYTNYFKTQGDANSGPDPGWTPGYNVLGKRNFWIPYLGYYIMFASSRPIIYLIILIPAILIVREQLEKLFEALDEESTGFDEENNNNRNNDFGGGRIPLENRNVDENKHNRIYKDQ